MRISGFRHSEGRTRGDAPDETRGGDTLLVMAKYWTPGSVKTRLGARIGMTAAAELHRLFTQRLTDTLADSGYRRCVLVSPDERGGEVAGAISRRWTCLPQGDGHLGQRMWAGFRRCFEAGDSRVVMIGCDVPTLDQPDIEEAFAALAGHDCVFGPAADGGYYLVGLRGNHDYRDCEPLFASDPPVRDGGKSPTQPSARLAIRSAGRALAEPAFASLFGELAWGTATVMADSLAIAAANGFRVAMLDEREDVDTWPDLARLVARLERSDRTDHTSLASQIRAVLGRNAFSDPDLPPV